MRLRRRTNLNGAPFLSTFLSIIAAGLFAVAGVSRAGGAEAVVFHLKSGDRVSGVLISEDAAHVVISNSWAGRISVPLAEIDKRETLAAAPQGKLPVTSKEPLLPPPSTAPQPKLWKGEAQLGMDVRRGARDANTFFGRFKLAYERPYSWAPRKSFRNGFDVSAEYGRTDGLTSSDRVSASDKIASDLTEKWYGYGLFGGGYDHVKHIDAQYEAGPGMGYHLFAKPKFSANAEIGVNYQAQFRTEWEGAEGERRAIHSTVEDVYLRLAQDLSWKPAARLTVTERLEVFPRINLADLRLRFETTASYELIRNLALNLTVLDLYDSDPARAVSRNEFQVRTSLGLKF